MTRNRRNRITRLAGAFTAVLAVCLMGLPLTAHAGSTIGSSNEAVGETPQITEFQVSPTNEQAGSHSVINIWMRFCGNDYDIDLDPSPPQTDFDARKITGASGTPIKITTQNAHTLRTNDYVMIQRVEGNTAANTPGADVGKQVIVPVDDPTTTADDFEATHTFTINGTSSNGVYVPGTGTALYAPQYGCNGRQVQFHNLLKDFRLSLPPGLLGNPTAVTPCPRSLFIASACPQESIVGNSVAMGVFPGGVTEGSTPIAAPTPLFVVDTKKQ